jgi:hypothetical protein
MAVQPHPDSLLGCLAALPDPRRRQGRRYPLPAILGLVLMGSALMGKCCAAASATSSQPCMS